MGYNDRVCILVDGGNFYHLVLKKLNLNELDFNFDKFVEFLVNGRKIIEQGKRYYIGTVVEKEGDLKSKEAMSKQTTLFTELRNNNWETKTSKLKKRYEEIVIDSRVADYENLLKLGIRKIKYERLREKGIDVKIATDLIVGAVDDKYDIAIVVSSDTDIIPAIDWVRNRKKKMVEYVGFSMPDKADDRKSTRPSLAMINKTDIQRTLIESDLKAFIKKTLFSSKQ